MTKAAKTKGPAKQPAPPPVPVTEAAPESVSGGKLGKTQLFEQVAAKARLSRKEVDVAVETLSVREMQTRAGRRPGTSERIQIPAGRRVAFKVASTLTGGL